MNNLKEKIRNILIYSFALTGIPALRRWWLKQSYPLVRVLTYHDVPESKRDNFKEQIQFLQERYNILTPKDFKEKNFHSDKINVLLTFDDGYNSWTEVVLPVLKKHNLGGIFFVSSGFIDTAEDKERERKFCNNNLDISHRRPLSWREVEEIDRASDCEIGGHTRTHPSLAQISKKEALNEIKGDKKYIEKKLNHPIEYFAFPYGKREDIAGVEGCVNEAGYTYAFTTEINFIDLEERNNTSIPRTMVSPTMSHSLLTCFVNGVYDIR